MTRSTQRVAVVLRVQPDTAAAAKWRLLAERQWGGEPGCPADQHPPDPVDDATCLHYIATG